MNSEMDQYRQVFIEEARELLQSLTDSLLALEKEPNDLAPVEECFRVAHSLKGMAATMSYNDIAQLTHKMESFLDGVRKKERQTTSNDIDLLLRCCDALQASVEALAGATEEAPGLESLAADLERAASAAPEAESHAPTPSAVHTRYEIKVRLDDGCVLKGVRAYMAFKRLNLMGEIEQTVPSMAEIEDEQFGNEFIVFFVSQTTPEKIKEAVLGVSEVTGAEVTALGSRAPEQKPAAAGPVTTAQVAEPAKLSEVQSVRVTIGHLDNMVNLVGELVITRARLESMTASLAMPELDEVLEELRRTSADLQHTVMKTRMVPVAQIFNRFPRMVRDAARNLGKQVEFSMEGLDIELDRTVLDEIGDPLVHLLRNAVGHGVETPEARVAAGKPEAATVLLRAAREQDAVLISVEDDGRGLDPEKLRRAFVEMGRRTEIEAASMTDEEAYYLICEPGFTTAKEATDLSGRGVGMDAVKGKIEHLGGNLQISSEPGKGARFTLLLPLTLAIIQALLVESDARTYAIPLSGVVEAAELGSVEQKVVQQRPVMILHDKVVPLVDLQNLLDPDMPARPSRGGEVVVVQIGEVRRGLVVDRLVGQQEVVIKPLDAALCAGASIGGATVLGDGNVALIIDLRGLQERFVPSGQARSTQGV